MHRIFGLVLLLLSLATVSHAAGLLDGRVFAGKIGPVENPDLADSLHFENGYFWSDICTKCGFEPGAYTAQETPEGIRFQGILESESRGQFTYTGLVDDNGWINVTINWQRKRWYWTNKREIAFQGQDEGGRALELAEIRTLMVQMNPDGNPLCARF